MIFSALFLFLKQLYVVFGEDLTIYLAHFLLCSGYIYVFKSIIGELIPIQYFNYL